MNINRFSAHVKSAQSLDHHVPRLMARLMITVVISQRIHGMSLFPYPG